MLHTQIYQENDLMTAAADDHDLAHPLDPSLAPQNTPSAPAASYHIL